MSDEKEWMRIRFESDAEDFRPIYEQNGNPEGPWWCSGYSGFDCEIAILVAFVKKEETLYKQWPEAKNLEIEYVDEPTFSDRFPKPTWWPNQPQAKGSE